MIASWLLGVALTARLAAAADVVVPEATPGAADDFAVSYMIYDMVASQLRDRDLEVADGEEVKGWVGSGGSSCYDSAACPQNLWTHTDARIAVVLSVASVKGGLAVSARLYARDRAAPVKTVTETVPEGSEDAFAERLALAVQDQVRAASLPAAVAEDEDDLPRTRTIPGEPAATKTEPAATKTEPVATKTEPAATKTTPPATKAAPPATKAAPTSAPRTPGGLTAAEEADRKKMGLPRRAYHRYLGSGADREEWLADERVRVGTLHVEAEGGLALGDVSRTYAIRVHLVQEAGAPVIDGASSYLGDRAGLGAGAGLSIGYTPFWFLDFALGGSALIGQKYLEDGWDCESCVADQQAVSNVYDPVTSVQLLLEPRVRAWLAPTGVVKPFVQVGAQLRVYDGFDDPATVVAFPDASGGVGVGLVGAAGLSLDVAPHASVTMTVPYTLTLSPGPVTSHSDLVSADPVAPDSWGGGLRVLVGVGVVY